MKRHRPVWKGTQRWLLTLLCLLASFAYLTRQTEPAEMPGMSVTQVAKMPGMPLGTQATARMRQPSGRAETPHLLAPDASTSRPASAEQMVARPNAPPASSHDHAGHCPFCFSAAFALEADGADLLFEPQPHDRLKGPVAARPHLLAPGHADARAPPTATV